MIRPEDVRFHLPKDLQHDWAETNFFSAYVPEANLTAWVYTIARPGVGAFVADIEAFDKVGRLSLDTAYTDFQQHLPLPERQENYSLPNGLTLRTFNEPRGYQIDYVGVDDTELHWTVTGAMEPFDIHDPNMDPMATPDPTNTAFGSAYANHFDMSAHVSGTIKIRGKRYDVDCMSIMDHSWGPRNERGMRSINWIGGNFGKDLAFQGIWSFDPSGKDWSQFSLAHGYVLIDGEVRGLTGGRLRATSRQGPFPSGFECLLIDKQKREYRFIGTTVGQHPWSCYSNTLTIVSAIRWYHEQREGYGMAQEIQGLDHKQS